jgi:putative colanic acid biosynthesis UDP-glucose lipid carrier transferase
MKDFAGSTRDKPLNFETYGSREMGLAKSISDNRMYLEVGEHIKPADDHVAGNSFWKKRVFDIAVTLLALPFLLPILAIAAVAIKITSPGPVLFKQHRYGLGRKRFKVFKLRTMTVAEDGTEFRQATRNDARVTRVGAFLRRTSIDELPQVFNVLFGDMSLVGPRPHPTKLDDDFAVVIPGYTRRFMALPGITGLAQVRGQRGETDTIEKMQARVDSDVEYAENHSLWLDFKILVQTVFVVLSQRNAC